MKRLILALGLASAASLGATAETITIGGTAYEVQRVVDKEIAPGVQYLYLSIPTRGTYGTHIWVTVADLSNPQVKVEYHTANNLVGGATKTLTAIAEANTRPGHTVVAGANANFWVTSETPWKNQIQYYPHGTAVSDGVMMTPPNQKTNAHVGGPTYTGAICIGTDGKAYIRTLNHQFDLVHVPTGHVMDLDDCNRVVQAGTASIYNKAYGTTKAFKPVTGANWDLAPGTCTEVLMDLKPGESWHVGGDTHFIIKEVRTNAGTGTLGDHDIAVVGRDSYATVMAAGYKVGDEVVLKQRFAMTNGQNPEIQQATSGNCQVMTDGVFEQAINEFQAGYNNNLYARTMYGTNAEGTKFYTAVCGNKTSTYYGMTTAQLNDVLRHLGATCTSQVDCGGSAQMYAEGKQQNLSTDGSGVRAVHSGMFIVSTADITLPPAMSTTSAGNVFGEVAVGESKAYTFNVVTKNLTSNVSVALTGDQAFTVTPSTIDKSAESTNITVTFAPKAAGNHAATVTLSGEGLDPITLPFSGTGKELSAINDEAPRAHYAYALSMEADSREATFGYTLTGDVRAVDLVLTPVDGASEALTFTGLPAAAGANTYKLALNNVPAQQYTWGLNVHGKNVREGKQLLHETPAKVDARGGVAVNHNPESPYFGYLATSAGYTQGISLYGPDMVKKGTYAVGNGTASNRSSKFRVAWSPADKVYTIDYADATAGIFYLDPANPEAGLTNIFTGTKDSGGGWTKDGVAMGGGGTGLCFTGSGETTYLWAFTEDYPAGNTPTNILLAYHLGNGDVPTGAPTPINTITSGRFANKNVSLFTTSHGILVSQNRGAGNNTPGCPGFVLMGFDGNIIYNSGDHADLIPSCMGSVALSPDETQMAVALGTPGIRIFNVSWEGHVPTLSTAIDVLPGTAGMSNETSQLAYDPAGNLFAWDRANAATCGLSMYAIPRENPVFGISAPVTSLLKGGLSGVENINVDAQAPAEYFDINGRRVDASALTPGLYIRRQGNTDTKIHVK